LISIAKQVLVFDLTYIDAVYGTYIEFADIVEVNDFVCEVFAVFSTNCNAVCVPSGAAAEFVTIVKLEPLPGFDELDIKFSV
jgi:hypothetical protein